MFVRQRICILSVFVFPCAVASIIVIVIVGVIHDGGQARRVKPFGVFDVLLSRRLVPQEENTTVTSASPTNKNGKYQKKFGASFSSSSLKKGKPLLPAVANSHSKSGACPPFDIPIYSQQEGTQTKRRNTLIPMKARNVHTVRKSKDSDKPAQFKTACRSHSLFFFVTARPR